MLTEREGGKMKKVISTISILLLSSFSLLAFAKETKEEEKGVVLEEVVVTATRDKREIRKVPANVTVVTREDIQNSNAQTVADALRSQVGLVVRDFLGNGKSASVDLRGFGETASSNTLVLIDGRRVNEIDLSGVDWLQIPLDQVERIEVVRGAGSALYGDNAVGGVINIITRRGEGRITPEAAVEYGSYGYWKERAAVSGSAEGLSYSVEASSRSTNGYRHNNDLWARDVGAHVSYDFTDFLTVGFRGGYHRDQYGLPGPLTESELLLLDETDSLSPYDYAETKGYYSLLYSESDFGDFGRFNLDLSARKRRPGERYFGSYIDFFGTRQFFSFEGDRDYLTYGITPRYILDAEIWGHQNKLTLGFDYYDTDMDVISDLFDSSGFVSRDEITFSKRSTGYYIQDELSVLESLILTLAYRYEAQKYKFFSTNASVFLPFPPPTVSATDDAVREDESAYKAALTFLYGEKSNIFASVARSFRFPLADEYFLFFPPPGLVNRTLRPQTARHYEAGIRHYFIPEVNAGLTLFWIDLHHEIYFNPLGSSVYTTLFGINSNYNKTRRQGLEFSFGVSIPESVLALLGKTAIPENFTIFCNYTYTKATFREGSFIGTDPFTGGLALLSYEYNDIPLVPRHKASLGFDTTIWRGINFAAVANYVGEQRFISDQANIADKLPSYITVDTKLSYRWKGLDAFVGVNNIFNKNYSEEGIVTGTPRIVKNYYPSPGLNYILGVSYRY
jgi:iron complex outermembrane receptor protein